MLLLLQFYSVFSKKSTDSFTKPQCRLPEPHQSGSSLQITCQQQVQRHRFCIFFPAAHPLAVSSVGTERVTFFTCKLWPHMLQNTGWNTESSSSSSPIAGHPSYTIKTSDICSIKSSALITSTSAPAAFAPSATLFAISSHYQFRSNIQLLLYSLASVNLFLFLLLPACEIILFYSPSSGQSVSFLRLLSLFHYHCMSGSHCQLQNSLPFAHRFK